MKKHFSLLAAAMFAMTLGACNNPATTTSNDMTSSLSSSSEVVETSTSSSVTSSSSELSLSSSSSSSSVSSSSSSSTSSVETPKQVEIGEVYKTNVWDITVKNMTKTVLGDLWEKIPEFTSQRYEALMAYPDGSNVLTFQIKCFGASANSALRLYKESMEAYGYYFSAENNYGYRRA